ESFVQNREIGNNVPENGLAERWSVLQRWIIDFATSQAVAGRRMNPVEDFAAPAFVVTDRDTVRRHFPNLRAQRAARQLGQHLPDDAKGLEKFFATDDHAPLHVAFGEDRHGELNLIVESVRKIATQIMVEAGGAARNANNAQVARDVGLEHPRGFG